MTRILLAGLALLGLSCSSGETPVAVEGEPPPGKVLWFQLEGLPQEIALFEYVFWQPLDTASLRKLIRETSLVKDKTVLEIGTGSGLLSMYALEFGASRVVATDVNPAAVANAEFNARWFDVEDRFEVRQVPIQRHDAYSVIQDRETFDVILSNPPWVNRKPDTIEEFALYDDGFQLLRTLLAGLDKHLNPGGKVLLAYGSVDGVRTVIRLASEMNLNTRVLDDRNLDKLEEEFLPGMLLEVTFPSHP